MTKETDTSKTTTKVTTTKVTTTKTPSKKTPLKKEGATQVSSLKDTTPNLAEVSPSKKTPSKLKQDPLSGSDLLDAIVAACSDAKGMDISALDVKKSFGLCDYFVIVSGRSDRQVQGICNRIIQMLAQHKMKPLAVEGLDKGHWALVDCGDVVVHVFYEPVREVYDLETLWNQAKKVKLNLPDKEQG